MKKHYWIAAFLLLGCSLGNREGVDASCEDINNGAINACGDGIITTCRSGSILFEVCTEKDACNQGWQEPGAYRCSESDSLPELSAGDGAISTGGNSGSGGGSSQQGGGDMGSGGSTQTDCSSTVCTIASTAGSIDDLTLDESSIYFAGRGSVFSVPKSGGPATELASVASSCASPMRLAIGGGLLFALCNDTVFRVPVSGGITTEEVGGQDQVSRLAADNQRLFWTGTSRIHRQLHGGLAEEIDGTVFYGDFLQVSGGFLYWQVQSKVERVPVDGTTIQSFAVSNEPRSMRVLENSAYLSLGQSVTSLDLTTGVESNIASGTDIRGVAVNATHVYWTEAGGTSLGIWSATTDGNDVAVFEGSQSAIRGMQADEQNVYWIEDSSVMKKGAL